MGSWLASNPSVSTAPGNSSLNSSELIAFSDALTQVLGIPAQVTSNSQYAAPQRGAIQVILTQSGPDTLVQGGGSVDMALRNRIQQQNLQGASALAVLSNCFVRANSSLQPGASAPMQAALQEWQSGCVRRGAELLLQEDGDDDLYFEGGKSVRQLLDALAAENAAQRVERVFLDALLAASAGQQHAKAWEGILHAAFAELKNANFKEPWRIDGKLLALDVLLQPNLLQKALAFMLLEEVRKLSGRRLEADGVLSALLLVGPFVDMLAAVSARKVESPAREIFATLRGYPERRDQAESQMTALRYPLERCQLACHQLSERVVRLKGTNPKALGKEAVLAWLTAAVQAGQPRTSGGEGKGVLSPQALRAGSSDRFALGVAALCLRYCRPFLPKDAAAVDRLDRQHMARLGPEFYAQHAHRAQHAQAEQTLAGRSHEGSKSPAASSTLSPEIDSPSAPHFVAECFFLAQQAVHTCLMPAVYRFSEMAAAFQRMGQKPGQDEDEEGQPAPGKRTPVELWLLQDCCIAQLMQPGFAADAVNFMVLEALWLHSLAQQDPDSALTAFRSIPESVVKDLTSWLAWVIRLGHAELLGAVPIGRLIAALTTLLQRPQLVRNAVVQSSIVELLSSMLLPLSRRSIRGVLGPSYMRPGEAALVAAVLGTGAAQDELVPALMQVYAGADNVVGLDVDRDRFDKFHFRSMIDGMLEALWKDEGCRNSLIRIAASKSATDGRDAFTGYVSAVLNSLLYLLPDCLHRLDGLYRVEKSRADEAGWNSLSSAERGKMDSYYTGEQRTTRGFMRMALQGLRMIDILSGELGDTIRGAFVKPPLLQLSAHAILAVLNTLMGPKAANLNVAKPEQYGYDAEDILVRMLRLCLRLAASSSAFMPALAADPDFSHSLCTATVQRMATSDRNTEARHVAPRFDDLLRQVAPVNGHRTKGNAGQVFSLSGQELPDMEQQYSVALSPVQIADFDASKPGAYNRRYAQLAQEAAGDTSTKMKRLSKEIRDLQRGKNELPLQPAASIFLRHDADRMDMLRACITGPEDTPYAYGLFMFDLFAPQQYPHVPPLMVLETTGGGRARMGPNVYADGKVCLSLLGTFHGDGQSAKWNPQYSSLFQLVMSVQTQIFTPDPYFNEPNTEQLRGTKEGAASDHSYNAGVVLATVRYAMVDALRNPRPGFELVVRTHFALLRHRVLDQCKRWRADFAGEGEAYQSSLVRAIGDLYSLLVQLA